MQIDLFSATGSKLKALDVPATLFESPVNWGLMHQAVVRQQSNRRQGSSAHVKTRGEVQGSTRKLFSQKHTGRARRGAVRSPLLRGGGKTFGPRNDRNFTKDMPQKMRHAALRSCLSMHAGKGNVIGLESYPDAIKTKAFADLLKKLPIEQGRKVLVVTTSSHKSLALSAKNVPHVKTVTANYLNPEDILNARHLVFLVDAINEAEKLFGAKKAAGEAKEKPVKKTKTTKKTEKTKKKSSTSSISSQSSQS